MRVRTVISCGLAVAVAAPFVGAAGCGGGQSANAVAAADFRFEPRRTEVEAGTTVKWTNSGRTAHNVIGRGFRTTSVLDPGQSYSHRFARAGTYDYLCTLHPEQMKGTVIVR